MYDLHGVYPPSPVEAPATERYPGGSGYPRGQPNSHYRSPPNPRFNGPSASFDPFGFTDPFDLFNQFFSEFRSDPFFANDPFFSHPPSFPGRRTHSLLDNFFPLIPGPSFAPPPLNSSMGHGFSFSSSSRSIRNGPDNQWVSESYQTTTTKDGTLTIQERVDANVGSELNLGRLFSNFGLSYIGRQACDEDLPRWNQVLQDQWREAGHALGRSHR